MNKAVIITTGFITSITPIGLFLVFALVIPHPFPGVAEAFTRILYAAMCVIVMAGSIVITWQNRTSFWFARYMTRLLTAIFLLAVLIVGVSFLGLPGLITVGGLLAILTFPILVLATINRVFVHWRGQS